MNNPIGHSHYHRVEPAAASADQSDSSISIPEAKADNQKQALPVSHVLPAHLVAAANDNTLSAKESKSLNEYVVQHCHSLRNFAAVTKPQAGVTSSGVSLSPENLLDAAEKRLLSLNELDEMHRYYQQQTDITFNGKRFELETLPEDTPLFYQFYCLDQKACIDDRSLRIFRDNCRLDPRPAIILTNKDLMNEKVAWQTGELERGFENVRVVDVSLLLKHRIHGMEITQLKSSDGRLGLRVDGSEGTLSSLSSCGRMVRIYESRSNIMDIFQFASMYHCDEVRKLAGIETKSKGCIKIDFDTELIAPIGALKCPDGFSTLVLDDIKRKYDDRTNELIHYLRVENGLVAVTRPKHPIMAESVCPNPWIFTNFSKAVSKLYNLSYAYVQSYDVKQVTPTVDAIDSLKILCDLGTEDVIAGEIDVSQQLSIGFDTRTSWKQKVAFPLSSIKADQSRVWGVRSWSEQTSTS